VVKLIFLGPPGSGKGTQAALIAQLVQADHISTGEILRVAVSEQTPLGLQAQAFMAQGELVPDVLVLGLVKERLQNLNGYQGWILDGFPRNEAQAEALDGLLAEIDQSADWAINLDVPDEILIARLLQRGRQDDNEEVIRNRLKVYRAQTAPLIDFYRSRDHLITINGNQDIQEVTTQIQNAIQQKPSH
jgi:adenylate kinase